jgi:flagellar basal body-associated protein FliL
MPLNFISRSDWRRRKAIKTMILVIVIAVLGAAVIAGVMLLLNSKR